MALPAYIEARIRRQPPEHCAVVPSSTPVIAFGHFSSSRVATLGLNPSRQEFLDRSGRELDGSNRRFETLNSLGVADLATAQSAAVEKVAVACEEYFERNPYRRWFDQLEPILQAVSASYYAGSACHLDIVQWATDPTWGKLSDTQKTRLVREDARFLGEQLRNSQIELLLLNGRAVMDFFHAAFGQTTAAVAGVERVRFVRSELSGVRVIGWSTNIQSSFGVSNDLRQRIAHRVRQLDMAAAN